MCVCVCVGAFGSGNNPHSVLKQKGERVNLSSSFSFFANQTIRSSPVMRWLGGKCSFSPFFSCSGVAPFAMPLLLHTRERADCTHTLKRARQESRKVMVSPAASRSLCTLFSHKPGRHRVMKSDRTRKKEAAVCSLSWFCVMMHIWGCLAYIYIQLQLLLLFLVVLLLLFFCILLDVACSFRRLD